MRRKPKIASFASQPCLPGLEDPAQTGALSIVPLEQKKEDDAQGLILEKILHRDNLIQAYNRVKSNKGAAGVDGMTVEQMESYLRENWQEIQVSLRKGTYKPKPVRRVEIPKPDGGVRMLGVPTVIDRLIQQAIAQVLGELFEPIFSDSSFGFRPGRSAHQAIKRAREFYLDNRRFVVDLDMAKYFDTVNHDLLINMIREHVKDEQVVRLIRKFLKSGVMIDGLTSPTTEGTPQGGPLSPLLSNIYLTKFDRMLESRGHKFVRYADDCNIYVSSQRSAQRVMASCIRFLEGNLKLKVNREKSQTGSPLELKFLGFRLYATRQGKVGICPHEKSLKRFRDQVRAITSRRRGTSVSAVFAQLRTFTTGWIGYYRFETMTSWIRQLDGWVRRRIRQYIWIQWKTASARRKNLLALGLPEHDAIPWSHSRKGSWRVSGAKALQLSLTNHQLAQMGYDSMETRFSSMERISC